MNCSSHTACTAPETNTDVMYNKIAKFERDIARYLMDVVSIAKECSPCKFKQISMWNFDSLEN